jgi:hypothetical protein
MDLDPIGEIDRICDEDGNRATPPFAPHEKNLWIAACNQAVTEGRDDWLNRYWPPRDQKHCPLNSFVEDNPVIRDSWVRRCEVYAGTGSLALKWRSGVTILPEAIIQDLWMMVERETNFYPLLPLDQQQEKALWQACIQRFQRDYPSWEEAMVSWAKVFIQAPPEWKTSVAMVRELVTHFLRL